MAGGIKVTPEQLQALSGTMAKTAGDVQGLAQALKGQLEPIFGAEWSGTASGQFQQLYTKFDQNARGLVEALQGISQLLKAAGESYAQAESQISSSFRA